MILLLDNFDSFTYNLRDYLSQVGVSCTVYRNDVDLQHIIALNPSAIVLSPGPGTPREAGIMNKIIAHYHQKVPILGVCLGHQALGEFYGARLVQASKPIHGKLSAIQCCLQDKIFHNIPNRFSVTRYHSLILTDIPTDLEVIAQTDQGEVMAIKHNTYPSYGIQYHPEALLTEYGLQFLENWATLFKLIG